MKHKYFSFYLLTLLITFFLLSSCASKRDILYFQNSDRIPETGGVKDTDYQIVIKPNDNLYVTVSSSTAVNPDAVAIFNSTPLNRSGSTPSSNLEIAGYLVDQEGNINLPLVGKIHVVGLTKMEAIKILQEKIAVFVKDAVINIRILNYKVTILGEVARPGVYTVTDERISIPQAIALAGDLTIYGERHNIQLRRIENGENKCYYIDLTSPDLFFSPNYYLLQNDVLYVSPNGTKVRSSTANQNIPLTISIITALLTVTSFFIRYK